MAQTNVGMKLHWEGLLFECWPGYLFAVLPEMCTEFFCVLSSASIAFSINSLALW